MTDKRPLLLQSRQLIPQLISAQEGPATPRRVEIIAYTGGKISVEGWEFPVVIDLNGIIPNQDVHILYNHRSERQDYIGHIENIRVDTQENKLIAIGVVSRNTPTAQDFITSLANGFPWRASVGMEASEYELVESETIINNTSFSPPFYHIQSATLREISIVEAPADKETSVAIIGKEKKTMQDNPNITASNPDKEPSVDEIVARIKSEKERQAKICALVEEHLLTASDPEAIEAIGKKAVEEKWTVQKTELELLRASRPRLELRPTKKADMDDTTIVAALAMAAGVSDELLAKDREIGPERVDKAYQLKKHGLKGILAIAASARGIYLPHSPQEFYRTLQASSSTFNLPGLLGQMANKILLNAFLRVDATYPLIAMQRDFANFNAHQVFRLNTNGVFEKVPSTGHLPHANLTESEYGNKLDTYGIMVTLPRQAIINDDLAAFTDLMSALGRKARLALEKALYFQVCEATDSFYTTAKGNRLTNNPLTLAGLSAAEAAMLKQRDEDGEPIYANPRYLLVPPSLKAYADSLFVSDLIVGGGADTNYRPSNNPFRGRFEVVSSPYLESAQIPGSGPGTWYLIADPEEVPAFHVAYLNGLRQPTIESSEAEWSMLGISWRCYWDFGVSRIDYRGAVKSTP